MNRANNQSEPCTQTVTCRSGDTGIFADLGFVYQEDDGVSAILVCDMAPGANDGLLPTDIPFIAENGESERGSYGDAMVVCDGTETRTHEVDCDGKVVVPVNDVDGTVDEYQYEAARQFVLFRNKVKRMIGI